MRASVTGILDEMQATLYQRALDFRDRMTVDVASLAELERFFADDQPGGFARAYAADDLSYADKVKDMKISARCMPSDDTSRGTCIFTGQENVRRIIFARSY